MHFLKYMYMYMHMHKREFHHGVIILWDTLAESTLNLAKQIPVLSIRMYTKLWQLDSNQKV
jgi:hypothetical protein